MWQESQGGEGKGGKVRIGYKDGRGWEVADQEGEGSGGEERSERGEGKVRGK